VLFVDVIPLVAITSVKRCDNDQDIAGEIPAEYTFKVIASSRTFILRSGT
jgi:hypothetical protein